MAKRGDVWASASQDYDSLLFGAPRLIRNVTISGRRKLPGKKIYIQISPELVDLRIVLKNLGITYEQLVDLGVLVGTDYNPGGVEGFGPKYALKSIKNFGDARSALSKIDQSRFDFDLEEVESLFLQPEVRGDYSLRWDSPDIEGVIDFLCGEHDFSLDRIKNSLNGVVTALEEAEKESTLDEWFH